MYSTLFGLLAATGLRISEALALRLEDVTEDGLIICETKFHKSRLVPLHQTARQALTTYLLARTRLGTFSRSLFVSTSGAAPAYNTVAAVFLQLVRSIGLRAARGQRGPRIHDLRHTFAIRSLEKCQPGRDAVSRHIVALSTYLGHAHVTDTYWYLGPTPYLMRQIADASETLLRQGAAT
jgi:integrase